MQHDGHKAVGKKPPSVGPNQEQICCCGVGAEITEHQSSAAGSRPCTAIGTKLVLKLFCPPALLVCQTTREHFFPPPTARNAGECDQRKVWFALEIVGSWRGCTGQLIPAAVTGYNLLHLILCG